MPLPSIMWGGIYYAENQRVRRFLIKILHKILIIVLYSYE